MGAREIPGSPVLGLHSFTAGGTGSIPGRGTKIPECHPAAKKKKKVELSLGGLKLYVDFQLQWGGGVGIHALFKGQPYNDFSSLKDWPYN